jgi:PAS domain S-box-containing protein
MRLIPKAYIIVFAVLALATSAWAMTTGSRVPFNQVGVIFAIAGFLQLCVAGYAIKLNRVFGMARVGWSLFWSFLLLALLHLIQSATQGVTGLQVDLEVVYMLISVLLLIGMVHLHTVLGEQQRVLREQEERKLVEQRMRDELESQVQQKTEHLRHAIETLRTEIEVRKRAEAQISEQARLLDLAHDAIVVHDLEGRIQYWNKGAENIYGWTAKEAGSMDISELLSPEFPGDEDVVKTVIEHGRWQGEAYNRTKDDQKVLVEEDWTLVCDAHGEPKSIMVISADITEKRRFETQTLRLQRMESIGTLASGIAHDLNNVLTPLLVAVQVLKDRITTENEKELLDTLKENVHRGARLVKQILTFGRGVKGERALVRPAQLARDIQQFVRETFPKSLKLELEIADDLWSVMGDATQLYQVLLNLCVNARDAMPDGGTLSIQMDNVVLNDLYAGRHIEAKPGPYVSIGVADTGTGIPEEIQGKIFEPFFTTKEQGKGTGLGLSTCFTILKHHAGFINCYSEPGKGSVFKAYLPASTSPCAPAEPMVETTSLPRGHGELVLIVDDEQLIREFAQITLECFGYSVLTVSNGAEAVALYQARQSEIAVIVMDMWMPVMDGPTATQALKSINPQVRIIGTSGLTFAAGNALETSFVQFLPKPYTADSLLHALDLALGGGAAEGNPPDVPDSYEARCAPCTVAA